MGQQLGAAGLATCGLAIVGGADPRFGVPGPLKPSHMAARCFHFPQVLMIRALHQIHRADEVRGLPLANECHDFGTDHDILLPSKMLFPNPALAVQ